MAKINTDKAIQGITALTDLLAVVKDMKDLGKIELQVGSKGWPVFGKQDVINELKQILRGEGLVGAY